MRGERVYVREVAKALREPASQELLEAVVCRDAEDAAAAAGAPPPAPAAGIRRTLLETQSISARRRG
jgi:hypothetical protein